MPSVESTNTNFIVFGLTRSELKTTTYRTRYAQPFVWPYVFLVYKAFNKVFTLLLVLLKLRNNCIKFEYLLVSIGIWRSKMQPYLSTRNGPSKTNIWDCKTTINNGNYSNTIQNACFESFPFRQKLCFFVCQTTWCWLNWLPVSMYTTKTTLDKWRFNVTQLKGFFFFYIFC